MSLPAQLNVSLDQTEEIVCEKCDNKFFQQGIYMRKASGFLTGTGKDTYIPIPVFACLNCSHVNQAFLPKEVQVEDEQEG